MPNSRLSGKLPLRGGLDTERLGLSVRFWIVTVNGGAGLVEFVEPQTRDGVAGTGGPQQTRRTGQPATRTLATAALRDNANSPVDNSETVNGTNPICSKQPCYPITLRLLGISGPVVATVSAAELLQAAGVAVRYVADPATAEQALSELATLPDTGPWGLDIETAPASGIPNGTARRG